MPNHPNRSRRVNPAANPDTDQIIALRASVQERCGMKITAAQDYCADLLHTSRRAWQQWERGDRRMHPAFWELARIKVDRHAV